MMGKAASRGAVPLARITTTQAPGGIAALPAGYRRKPVTNDAAPSNAYRCGENHRCRRHLINTAKRVCTAGRQRSRSRLAA